MRILILFTIALSVTFVKSSNDETTAFDTSQTETTAYATSQTEDLTTPSYLKTTAGDKKTVESTRPQTLFRSDTPSTLVLSN